MFSARVNASVQFSAYLTSYSSFSFNAQQVRRSALGLLKARHVSRLQDHPG